MTDVSATPPAQNASDIKILVVEDEPDLSALYTRLLSQEGYTVHAVDNGQDALLLLRSGGYDLVLLDIMLPKMDGLQILEVLHREPPKVPNKSVVLLTNLNQDDVIARAVQYNVRSYMVKSDYTPDKFLAEIKQILAT